MLKELDTKANGVLESVGITDTTLQKIVKIGGLTLLGVIGYKLLRNHINKNKIVKSIIDTAEEREDENEN
jgi:uncharacterized membrane protein YebE (DUF533 family)